MSEMDDSDLHNPLEDLEPGTSQGEDLFQMCMIDKHRLKKITIELKDKAGDEVSLKDITKQLCEYIYDKMREKENNATISQIYPLMAQTLGISLIEIAGDERTAALLMSQEMLRHSILTHMALGFYLLKFIQKNELEIITIEEDVSQEEVDRIMRVSKATSTAAVAGLAGIDPKQVIREMVKNGTLSKEDLGTMADQLDDDEDDSPEVKKDKDKNKN